MRNPILATLTFMATLALTDVILNEGVGVPRWASLIIALVLAGLAAWGVHKLLDNPLERSARDGRRWEAEHRSRQAWKAEQRRIAEAESRKPHPEVPADLPPAPAPTDPDFETRELPAVAPEPGRSPNQVDRAVDRVTSTETPADRDVRRAAEGGQSRIERFFD